MPSAAKKMCSRSITADPGKALPEYSDGGRGEQRGASFSLVIRERLPKGVTFQLRPEGISQAYGVAGEIMPVLGKSLC